MLEMNALTLAASEDSMSATALLGETMEEGITQLEDIPRWYQRAARNVKRLWNKMFGRSPDYAFDTEQVAMEMQNMGSNDLKEALLDSLEDTHIQGTHLEPKPDGSYQPPEEFGLGDDGILEAPPAMAGEAENMGTIVDQMVDAGADAVIGAVDGALDRIPGFDAITSAVNRGISRSAVLAGLCRGRGVCAFGLGRLDLVEYGKQRRQGDLETGADGRLDACRERSNPVPERPGTELGRRGQLGRRRRDDEHGRPSRHAGAGCRAGL